MNTPTSLDLKPETFHALANFLYGRYHAAKLQKEQQLDNNKEENENTRHSIMQGFDSGTETKQ